MENDLLSDEDGKPLLSVRGDPWMGGDDHVDGDGKPLPDGSGDPWMGGDDLSDRGGKLASSERGVLLMW
jgi:hypothetical protein